VSTAILGVGATKRLSAVRWGIAGKIVLAWIFTLPVCIAFAWGFVKLFA
jgi:PiT family inorganic phosphate transporter